MDERSERQLFNMALRAWVKPVINPPAGPPEDDAGLPPFVEAEAFRILAKDWAMQLEVGQDPISLSNVVLEYIRNFDTQDHKVFSSFIAWISVREWPKAREALSKHLDTKGKDALALPAAEPFYKDFKDEVLRQIRDYWKAVQEGQPMED